MHTLSFTPALTVTGTALGIATCFLLRLPVLANQIDDARYGLAPDDVRLAAHILARATDFAPGPMGPGATPSTYALAFRIVAYSRDRDSLFLALARESRYGARLWGLAGLKFDRSPAYEVEAAKLRGSTVRIGFGYGCVPFRATVGSIVRALDTTPLLAGVWDNDLPEETLRALVASN